MESMTGKFKQHMATEGPDVVTWCRSNIPSTGNVTWGSAVLEGNIRGFLHQRGCVGAWVNLNLDDP